MWNGAPASGKQIVGGEKISTVCKQAEQQLLGYRHQSSAPAGHAKPSHFQPVKAPKKKEHMIFCDNGINEVGGSEECTTGPMGRLHHSKEIFHEFFCPGTENTGELFLYVWIQPYKSTFT